MDDGEKLVEELEHDAELEEQEQRIVNKDAVILLIFITILLSCGWYWLKHQEVKMYDAITTDGTK